MISIDAVIVTFNSESTLADCLEPLVGQPGVRVIVVDNASADDSLAVAERLGAETMALRRNGGFAHGCNAGWRSGTGEAVLFLNPDARISPDSLTALACVLDREPGVGAVAPLIRHTDGTLDFSLRRYPRLRSTYARALFLHRIFPRRTWSDEVVRDPDVYVLPSSPDWASGACLLVRRSALERLDGFDEGFFMYCEDIDLCKRLRGAGFDLRFEPSAVAHHEGGVSAPRTKLLPVLAASRVRYAQKHWASSAAMLERSGLMLESVTHLVVTRGGLAARRGHGRAIGAALSGRGNPT